MPSDHSAGGKERFVDDSKGAVFGPDLQSGEKRKYRYKLWRTWDAAKPAVAFIMLNPSTADETADDPTIRRCIGYARKWGYGTLLVGNLFGVRTPDPAKIGDYFDPVGPENDEYLTEIASDAEKVVAAWGTNGSFFDRDKEVIDLLDAELHALDTTKDGHPCHPLYQPADLDLERYPNEVIRNV